MSPASPSPLPFSRPPAGVAAVVLAAGASQRLGQPKQLVAVNGQPLLGRAIDQVLSVSALWPVVVVLGAYADRIRPVAARRPVLIAENPAWAEGMASSLRSGLITVQQFSREVDAVLFVLCDQPRFSADAIEEILAARSRTGAGVVAAAYGGHAGAPALISRQHFSALAQLTGDEGARRLFAILPPGAMVTVPRPELAEDVDTPEDLQRLTGPVP